MFHVEERDVTFAAIQVALNKFCNQPFSLQNILVLQITITTCAYKMLRSKNKITLADN